MEPLTPIRPVTMPGLALPNAVWVPPWISVILGELGTLEDKRKGMSNPRIEDYGTATRGGRAVDDVAWCSSAACFALETVGVVSPRHKTASTFTGWGVPCGWVFGCLVFFPPSDPDAASSGHVAFLLGLYGPQCWVVGGNQSDAMTIALKKRAGAITRWPAGLQIPAPLKG